MRRLRSALFHLIYGKAAGLRPLRSFAPQAIVLSPGFYLTDKNLPPEGASTLNLITITKQCQTPAVACTKRHDPQLSTNHYPLLTINHPLKKRRYCAGDRK